MRKLDVSSKRSESGMTKWKYVGDEQGAVSYFSFRACFCYRYRIVVHDTRQDLSTNEYHYLDIQETEYFSFFITKTAL